MPVTVRPAEDAEHESVGELTVAAYAAGGFVDADSDYAGVLRNAAARAGSAELYVAEVDGALAGTVTFCPEGSPFCEVAGDGEGEFRMLAVLPTARRNGVAQALVGACIERAQELGYRALVLSSMRAQREAHCLYEKLGFERTPRLDWSPVEGVELLAYRLDLRETPA